MILIKKYKIYCTHAIFLNNMKKKYLINRKYHGDRALLDALNDII